MGKKKVVSEKDPQKLAEELIKRGKQLKDDKLVKMGEALLSKHKKQSKDNCIVPIRQNPSKELRKRIVEGKEEGTYTKKVPIQVNIKHFDDGKTDKNDKTNKILKKFTQHTPRTREHADDITLVCSACGSKTKATPFDKILEERFRCPQCIMLNRHSAT